MLPGILVQPTTAIYASVMVRKRSQSSEGLRSTAPSSFRAYVRQLARADLPDGELVIELKNDSKFPDVRSWAEVRRYLNKIDAAQYTFVTARLLWRKYRLAQSES